MIRRPAVYRLEHMPSGRVYVGASSNWSARRRDWFVALGRVIDGWHHPRGISLTMLPFVRGTLLEDWVFSLLQEFEPDVSGDELQAAELAHIQAVRAVAGELMLNSSIGFTMLRPSYNRDPRAIRR